MSTFILLSTAFKILNAHINDSFVLIKQHVHCTHVSISPICPSTLRLRKTIVIGIVRASVPNWFPDDNLQTKSWIEARCGMYVYLMNI